MDLKGTIVKHEKYGEGIIIRNNDKILTVRFPEIEKKFIYPDAIGIHLTVIDPIAASAINDEINEMKLHELERIETQNKATPIGKQGFQSDTSSTIRSQKEIEDGFRRNALKGQELTFESLFMTKESMLAVKKVHEEKVKELLEKRKIQYFVHFTRLDNLASILQYGLVPVNLQQGMKIKSICNDDKRLDFRPDCTSCSVEFPNYRLFYTFREHKFPGTHCVIIAIVKEVVFSPANIAYYCSTNAARVIPRTINITDLCTSDAFESMFCETFSTKGNVKINRASLQIDDNWTTDPQAEILISDIIGTQYIRGIFFQSQQDRDDYISQNGSDELCLYNHQVDPSFFAPRKDFTFWL
jgi:hypothetical protein